MNKFALLLALASTGCAFRTTPVLNTVDVSAVDWTNVDTMKRGQGCATFLFGFIPVGGSASMVNAVKDANVTKVNAVATNYKNYIVIAQSCVEVWGE